MNEILLNELKKFFTFQYYQHDDNSITMYDVVTEKNIKNIEKNTKAILVCADINKKIISLQIKENNKIVTRKINFTIYVDLVI